MSVISKLPLSRLITPRGEAVRQADAGSAAIRDLLRASTVSFVVADIGKSLYWVNANDCFSFWKQEVQPHLAELDQKAYLQDFPGEYLYVASLWDDGASPIVLLEKRH